MHDPAVVEMDRRPSPNLCHGVSAMVCLPWYVCHGELVTEESVRRFLDRQPVCA
jgi:hypothetical protein